MPVRIVTGQYRIPCKSTTKVMYRFLSSDTEVQNEVSGKLAIKGETVLEIDKVTKSDVR